MPIPPLAGLCTYEEAALVGFGVDENVARFLRYAWLKKRLMEATLRWISPTPEWEIKEAFSLHAHLDADHARLLRTRVSEMRNPMPRMDVSPDPRLDTLFDELATAATSQQKVVGLYGIIRVELLAALQDHLTHVNPLVDFPTRRMLQSIITEETQTVAWGAAAMAALAESDTTESDTAEAGTAEADAWAVHVRAYLRGAGGIAGDDKMPTSLPAPRAASAPPPDYFPQRDERFTMRWNFVNPQRQVSLNEEISHEERALALMCRRVVEMDVAEYMSRIIVETKGEPWDYYVEMTRQLWDEARHAMMGAVYFQARGIDWKGKIAIHPGMSIRLIQGLSVEESHLVLYAIEQNLMPATTGKRHEYEISLDAHDRLAALFQDYDWADEVLHVHTGRKWLLPKTGLSAKEAVEAGWAKRAGTAPILDQYTDRGEQINWWPDFVEHALGRVTDVKEFNLVRL